MKQETTEHRQPPSPSLAIIGMGCLFPGANDLKAYWANIKNRVDSITPVPATHWKSEDYYDPDPKARDKVYANKGGFLSPVEFNPLEFGISPRDIEAIDTTQLLGLVAAQNALKDAGYGPETAFDRQRVSVILGVTGALEMVVSLGARLGHPHWRRALLESGLDGKKAEEVVQRISASYVEWQENSFPGLLGNVAAGRIANRLDLGGTNCVVDAACASSLSALYLASLELAAGRSDLVITGGMDTFNDVFMYACFSKTPALSPFGNARPFDQEADGTILGEGLGIIVLKRLEQAQKDNDRIYAVIRGLGSSSDGKGTAVYAPNHLGQIKAIKNALNLTGISPETVELIEAHGTGTMVGDEVEIKALLEAYAAPDKKGSWCALGSVKSQIGHTKAAAGAAGIIKAALALYHKVLPPTIKVTRPPEKIVTGRSPFYVNTEKRPWMPSAGHPRRAAVSSFGFGGSNFHLLMEEAQPIKQKVDWDGQVQLVPFSAPDRQSLIQKLRDWAAGIQGEKPWLRAADLRNEFEVSQPQRIVLVINPNQDEVGKTIEQAIKRLETDKGSDWHTPDGVYYGHGPAPGKLAVLFPGQGSQYVGMQRDLACQFPEMHEVLVEADAVFSQFMGESGPKRLSDHIYPLPFFDEEKKSRAEEALKDTRRAQPALGAIGLGMYRIMERFGLNPDFVAGHSYGELLALCAAGCYGSRDLIGLSSLRGKLMAKGNGHRGAMLAVRTGAGPSEKLIRRENLDLVVANKNGPRQTVLSGAVEDIEKAAALFTGEGIGNTRLRVSTAFHSPFMSHATGPFSEALDKVDFFPAKIPAFANSTARPYPLEPDPARKVLAGQLVRPVEFIQEIENMYDEGVRVFLEVGPGRSLTGLVRDILESRPHQALAMDSSAGKRHGLVDLARALAHLAALGYNVQTSAWEDGPEKEAEKSDKKPAYTVTLCGANQFKPSPVKIEKARIETPPRASQMDKKDITSQTQEPLPQHPTGAPARIDSRPKTKAPRVLEAAPVPGPDIDPRSIGEALRLTRENMRIMQEMQANTARLHQQFLSNQEQAQKNMQDLIGQQQKLLLASWPSGAAGLPPESTGLFQTEYFPPQEDKTSRPETVSAREPSPPSAQTPDGPEQGAARSSGIIEKILLEVVAEQTGYPLEMLSLDMGLDTDLGIDSIKRVEILSALAERLPQAPAIGPEQMGSIETLAQVAAFLNQGGEGPARPHGLEQNRPFENISAVLLEIVSEQTGYPLEMLSLDMGLDADLGVDSIKRVEILSALAERLPQAPVIGPEHLGTIETLRQVVEFLSDHSPAPVGDRDGIPGLSPEKVAAALLDIVSRHTGYPLEMLSLDMGMDADLGVDSIKRVEILSALAEELPGAPAIGPEHLGSIETLAQVVEFLSQAPEAAGLETTAPAQGDANQIAEVLLELVAEHTGYPLEMLSLDMGLDADLGVDSIKRVEILSALAERLPQAPVIGPEHLGTIETLRQVVDFLSGQEGGQPETRPVEPGHGLYQALLQAVSETTGYPVEALDPHLSLDLDLGLDPIRLLEILENLKQRYPSCPILPAGTIGQYETLTQLAGALGLGQDMAFEDRDEPLAAAPLASTATGLYLQGLEAGLLDDPAKREPAPLAPGSTLWIRPDGTELTSKLAAELADRGFKTETILSPDQAGLLSTPAGLIVLAGPDDADDDFPGRAFELIKLAGPSLRQHGLASGAILATVSRLDGAFGLNGPKEKAIVSSGGLAGLAKTVGHEWPMVSAKALDLDIDWDDPAAGARFIADEALTRGPAEVGLSPRGRMEIKLSPLSDPWPDRSGPIGPGDLVLISGGARGVTAQTALALARSYQPTLVLLGRSPEPSQEPDWLSGTTSEAELKKAILGRSQTRLTPRELEKEYALVRTNREILTNIEKIEEAGSTVLYRSVNVCDPDAIRAVVDWARAEFGPVRGLIHGAGVLADRLLEDKTREQFDLVFGTKVKGLKNLLAAIDLADLKFLALFSSSTGRFGRSGQVDYAAANEVLNKTAARLATGHPHLRVVSFNWGPWDGGMVTAGLKKLFRQEGIGLIPPVLGAEFAVRELAADKNRPVEIVVFGPDGVPGNKTVLPVSPGVRDAFCLEMNLSLNSFPVLSSHVIDGQAVLPLALMMELMALPAQNGPGQYKFSGFDRLKVLSRLAIASEEEAPIQVKAGPARNQGQETLIPVELVRRKNNETIIQARADLVLTSALETSAPRLTRPFFENRAPQMGVYGPGALFHGPAFMGLTEIKGCSDQGLVALCRSAPDPEQWIKGPFPSTWYSDPLILDCCFQTITLWCLITQGQAALPVSTGRYRRYKDSFPRDGAEIVLNINSRTGPGIKADIEIFDRRNDLLARFSDLMVIMADSLKPAFLRNRLDPSPYSGTADNTASA